MSFRRWARQPSLRLWSVLCGLFLTGGCDSGSAVRMVTVYSSELAVSIPVPVGWRTENAAQAGYQMQIFTGPSADVPDRAGIRVQVMTGPLPRGRTLDELARRYTEGQEVLVERGYSLHGAAGRTWYFESKDAAESSRLMLAPLGDRLYGLYAHGESGTIDAYGAALDRMWEEFSVERVEFFVSYDRPQIDLSFEHPRSWKRTSSVGDDRAFFVGFRSPPLAAQRDETTIHATLEVSVGQVAEDTTLEGFYTSRTESLGDNYRLLRHEATKDGRGFSDLYATETQLADYLERTFYYLHDQKSYIFKFIAPRPLYVRIEPWIDEMAKTFAPGD